MRDQNTFEPLDGHAMDVGQRGRLKSRRTPKLVHKPCGYLFYADSSGLNLRKLV